LGRASGLRRCSTASTRRMLRRRSDRISLVIAQASGSASGSLALQLRGEVPLC
jgi:hypothetical protein